jgi:NAD(P)H dehydrogenase (quinone)
MMMSTQTFLVIGATGKTGQHTVHRLLEKGHGVRAMVHAEDERSKALRGTGVEVVLGELLEHEDVIRATPAQARLIFAIPLARDSFRRRRTSRTRPSGRRLKVVVNMSQISAREDSESHAARDHWIAERLFDWSGVPTVHIRPTFF